MDEGSEQNGGIAVARVGAAAAAGGGAAGGEGSKIEFGREVARKEGTGIGDK